MVGYLCVSRICFTFFKKKIFLLTGAKKQIVRSNIWWGWANFSTKPVTLLFSPALGSVRLAGDWPASHLTKSLFTSCQNSIFLSQQSAGTVFFSPAEQALAWPVKTEFLYPWPQLAGANQVLLHLAWSWFVSDVSNWSIYVNHAQQNTESGKLRQLLFIIWTNIFFTVSILARKIHEWWGLSVYIAPSNDQKWIIR